MARKPAPEGSDRRQQILAAALELFSEQGLEGATSKDIAERAEVTHGLIYFYFKTKEDLFKAAFEYALERALAQLDVAAIAQSDEPPEQALTRFLTDFLETLASPRMASISQLMLHTMAHSDWRVGPLHECKLLMRTAMATVFSALRDYLDHQMALGRLRPLDTDLVARFLVGGVVSSVRWGQTSERIQEDAHAVAAALADSWVHGLLLAPGAPPVGSVDAAPEPSARSARSAKPAKSAQRARAAAESVAEEQSA